MEDSPTLAIYGFLGAQPTAERPTVARAVRMCPLGAVVAARHRGRDVAVARRLDGEVFVMPDRCPHDGGRLSDGFVDGETIVCSRHGWEFSLDSGRCVGRPQVEIAAKPLKSRDS